MRRGLVLLVPFWLAICGAALAQSGDPEVQAIETRARAGEVAAQAAMAQRYHNGDGVLQDYARAADWARRAAEQGDAAAQNLLGRYLSAGLGVAQNSEQALHWLRQAAAQGAPEHLYDLGRLLDATAPEEAAQAYAAAAKAGHVEAAVSLGVLYQAGRGVVQDHTRALGLYAGAATQGSARAQNNLGLLYVRGHGTAQDYGRAAALFAAAAEQGLKQAMINLGVMYANGFGVPVDEARAAELYRLAGQGNAATTATGDAVGNRGQPLIYDSRLAPPAVNAALHQAARAGDPVAQFQLGWALLQTGDPGQHRQAAALFREAAAAGYAPAMTNLGVMYFEGLGLPQDYMLGQMWLIRAAISGLPETAAARARYDSLPTPAQLNEAQSLARETARPGNHEQNRP